MLSKHQTETNWAKATGYLIRIQPRLTRMVPFVAAFCFLAWLLISVRSNFSWDDADPEVLNQAWRLAKGESIYRSIDLPPYTFAAYTPVYYALCAVLLKLTGLSFLPAKVISLLAALAIGWALVHVDRLWNKTGRGGLWSAFLLFLVPAFLYNSTRSNVQMLAVAFSIWSLVFFVRNRGKEAVLVSPLLAVLAFYTKQTQIALPLATVTYLAFKNRRRLVAYLIVLTGAGFIPFLWLQKITGGNFYLNTVRLAGLSYDIFQIPQILVHHAGPLLGFIALALFFLCKRLRRGTWEVLDCYLMCLLGTTIVSLGRVGAHGQYVLELLVVTVVYLLRSTGLPAIKGHDLLVSIQVLILLFYAPLFVFLEEGVWDVRANRAAPKIFPVLNARPGPILSQQNSFPLFSRGEIYIQLFHFTALSRAGLWDQNRLVNEIERRTFSFVITEFALEQPVVSDNARERFTPEMIDALRRNYRCLQAIRPYYLYVPRQAEP